MLAHQPEPRPDRQAAGDALVAAGTTFMREVNAAAILRRLRAEPRMSVSALAEAVGLSRQAVGRSLAALSAEGLVEYAPPERGAARAGRPAQLVRFRAEAGYVIGLSISPEDVRVAVSDLAGSQSARYVLQLGTDGDGEAAVAALVAAVADTLESAGIATDDVWFASVGAPGIVDPEAGMIKLIPSMPGLTGDLLARRLKDTLGCPIYVDNDVKLMTQGERLPGTESLVMVYWGERVGAGVVMNGELYRGSSNDAGDIGFLDLLTDRPPVAPPRQPHGLGPFEEWVGPREIERLTREAARRAGDDVLERRIDAAGERALSVVLDAVADGSPSALEAVDLIAARFARGVVAIRAILDPERIVIGGPLARAGEALLSAIRRHLADQPLNQPTLEVSTLGDDAVLHGALQHCLAEVERTRFGRLESRLTSRSTQPI